MAVISNIVREVAGLFIEDFSLGAAVAVLLIAAGAAHHAKLMDSTLTASVLCCGLAAILIENVLRGTRAALRSKLVNKT